MSTIPSASGGEQRPTPASARLKYVKIAAESFAAGALSGAVVNGVWLLVTGRQPSLLVTLVAAQAVTSAWAIVQAARFQRKWQAVVEAYHRPALGEGIDTPHRPPASSEDEGGAA